MKYSIAMSMILAMISADMALAKHCHAWGHRAAHSKGRHGTTNFETKVRRPVVIERDAQSTRVDISEIKLDAGGGRLLRQLLSENLGAEVEWGNARHGERVVTGAFHGSPESIAQQLLKDFQFAIFYDHSRLRIIVLRLNAPEIVADNRPRVPAQPQAIPSAAPNHPAR